MSGLLVLDTATPATVVGVRVGGELVELRHDPVPGERPGHVTELPGLVLRACREAGVELAELDRIGASVGPGSFTGLRIGLATARSLGQATGVALVPVPTLAALAAPASAHASTVVAVLDARRGEAFVAVHRDGVAVDGPLALAPGELAALVATLDQPLAVGSGATLFRDVLAAAGASVPDDDSALHRIGAAGLCEVAVQAQPVGYHELAPEYVRAPDASPRPVTGTAG
ncbi:MAG TPA: tRNA (adenosine(37)-N6)-threonylcarbamoyltransferase complex dimerization subunit type 1 TsaB [Solirubrobacteraceae bacterium]|nr:tRNA (adenosine(37)-N6)-threonylcarbamoyltransferase complex dimerization subunit type 1 TsaB [Solirubrobacteraceae bacterium]